MSLSTPLTELFGIQHPILLAGMAGAAGPPLAAAVTNAGGMGCIGGLGMSPEALRKTIKMIKQDLVNKEGKFGVDLALPQVGGSARKTNYDYTGGKLKELIDVIVEEKPALFICAIGIPPKWAVDQLHSAGIAVMNMVGDVKHVTKACGVGVDLVCAQGAEGGGHTGSIPTSILLPKVVDAAKGHVSPLTGGPVLVLGAGGIFDGRGVAMALAAGCAGVWVGTRFIASEEAGAGPHHKKLLLQASYGDIQRSEVYSGRPLNTYRNDYIREWHENRGQELKDNLAKGVIPRNADAKAEKESGVKLTTKERLDRMPALMGLAAGAITEIKPAKAIVDEMIADAHATLSMMSGLLRPAARL